MSTVKSILAETQSFSPVPVPAPVAAPVNIAPLLWEDEQDLIFERIDAFKKKNGITSSVWCCDAIGDDDFDKPHGYTCKWITNGLHRRALKGNTWLDVWKCADKIIKKQVTDHVFIERFWVKGDTLWFDCGS